MFIKTFTYYVHITLMNILNIISQNINDKKLRVEYIDPANIKRIALIEVLDIISIDNNNITLKVNMLFDSSFINDKIKTNIIIKLPLNFEYTIC